MRQHILIFTSLVICQMLLMVGLVHATPITYEWSGYVSNTAPQDRISMPDSIRHYDDHPNIYTGQKVSGVLNWDTDLFVYGTTRRFIDTPDMTLIEADFDDFHFAWNNEYMAYGDGYPNNANSDSFLLDDPGRISQPHSGRVYVGNTFTILFNGSTPGNNPYNPQHLDFTNFDQISFTSSLTEMIDFDGVQYDIMQQFNVTINDIHSVPEPSTMLLMGVGLAGLLGIGKRKR